MDNELFLKKMRTILKKTYHDFLVVSDDIDCECDYGIDANGHLIIAGASTLFLLSELENITYYDDSEMDIEEPYIHFCFKNNTDLFLYYNGYIFLGEEVRISLNGHYLNYSLSKIILNHSCDWDYLNNDFLIEDNKTLVAYIGNDEKFKIPDGVEKIGEYAFSSCNNLEEVILPDTLIEIGDNAFIGSNNLKHIDLNKVEIIGESAFQERKLESITIPESVKTIRKNAFSACLPILLNNIVNHSSVVLDENIIKPRD